MPNIERGPMPQLAWVFAATDYDSARRARREFSSLMSKFGASRAAVADCVLIFGELVGNAVRHAGGEISARLVVNGSQPVLCVCDRSSDSVLRVPRGSARSESGRGLKIVLALARDVWVERRSNGKAVCAALPCKVVVADLDERGEVSA